MLIAAFFDIIIGVITDGSFFNLSIDRNLFYTDGNITIPVVINPTVLYIYLPFGTCKAIAANLSLI